MSPAMPYELFDLTAYRPGQAGAHAVALGRLIDKEPYTTIVLPCGYGKSDLIRMVALEAWYRKVISATLVLSPTTGLRDQLIATQKIQAWIARYKITVPHIKIRKLGYLVPNFTGNGEFLASATTHLIERNLDFFVQWIDFQCRKRGLPPLICIDEAQNVSTDNAWGDAVMKLVKAGARAMLVTATPERSDDKPIPGFPCEEISNEDDLLTLYRNTDDPLIKEQLLYATQKRTWRLVAHHKTTFSEAWAEGNQAIIDRFPYDAKCEEMTNARTLPEGLLSQISGPRVQEYLGTIVREASVEREGVKLFVEALSVRKSVVPEAAGMIFVANDRDRTQERNTQAKHIQRRLKEARPDWKVFIATDEESAQANADIQRFADEDLVPWHGDVLIVKQMAACGVDVPRCKVLLDLSPMRAPVGWIQRIMRINRLYKELRGVFISVDDVVSRTLFQSVVGLASKDASHTYTEIGELLDTDLITVKPSERWRALFIGDMAPAEFSDSQNLYASAEEHPIVRHIVKTYPVLTTVDSLAGIAHAFRDFEPRGGYPSPAVERPDLRAADERQTINKRLANIAGRRLGSRGGSHELFAEEMQALWNTLKPIFGIPYDTKFGRVDDLTVLAAIKRHVIALDEQERKRYGTTH